MYRVTQNGQPAFGGRLYPDLEMAVCWHGGSTFNVHPWASHTELTFRPTDAFTRYSEDKSGEGEPPEPEEAVRFASEWLQRRRGEF